MSARLVSGEQTVVGPRNPVNQRTRSLIKYCKTTKDYLIPSVWGTVSKAEDPYAPQAKEGCQCIIM